ncbi:hypothetical protein V1515DRAFT_616466 [Lipomyces mesembrius]
MKIDGRTFNVSGGASGLGLRTTQELMSYGGYVAVVDRDEKAGERVMSQIFSSSKLVRFFKADVTDAEHLEKAVDAVLGCVVSAAGIVWERGVIVLVSSVSALEGRIGHVAYGGSKGAVASMTLPMARDLAQWGIRVVALAPRVFDTAMTAPMPKKTKDKLIAMLEFPRRFGRADEFARMVSRVIQNVIWTARRERGDYDL